MDGRPIDGRMDGYIDGHMDGWISPQNRSRISWLVLWPH